MKKIFFFNLLASCLVAMMACASYMHVYEYTSTESSSKKLLKKFTCSPVTVTKVVGFISTSMHNYTSAWAPYNSVEIAAVVENRTRLSLVYFEPEETECFFTLRIQVNREFSF